MAGSGPLHPCDEAMGNAAGVCFTPDGGVAVRFVIRGVPIAFACKREATPIKRKLLVPIAAGMVTA